MGLFNRQKLNAHAVIGVDVDKPYPWQVTVMGDDCLEKAEFESYQLAYDFAKWIMTKWGAQTARIVRDEPNPKPGVPDGRYVHFAFHASSLPST